MKNMSKTAKFFLICAVIFTLGLVLTVGGCAAGGVAGIEKAVDGSEWSVNTDPVDVGTIEKDFEFSSIEATGEADFVIVGSKYYKDALEDGDVSGIEAKAGKVVVIYDKSKDAPEVRTDGDRLVIEAGKKDNNIYFSENYFGPKVIVFCDDKELESISVSSSACDIDIKGVSFKTADLGMNAGDVDLKDIISGGLKVVSDAGDIEIAGVLKGSTDVKTDAGSIEIDVFNGITAYTMDLHTDAGELRVGDDEMDGGDYTQKGGDDSITVRTDAGDISIGNL